MWLEVVPAYGRDYKNQKDVKEDWNEDLDFQLPLSGQYINKSQAKEMKVLVRYSKQTKIVQVQ